ncbi:DIL domain-containing protein [Cristinia sonorae]|uniref:DIL domain-containing protein n=1 Tax=Cristinia sonorae TaxID=1940300 RepID=A0A8K0US01_9AGAR|nr:DIL domain-containing protein [Cristinia sonorae]
MASTSTLPQLDLQVEPDLQPLYPTPAQISHLLSPNVGLSPSQKEELVSHCLTRACIFGDFALLSYLLLDPVTQAFVDLGKQDDDGLGLISTTILGFGSDSDRDVEREECVRLLVSEGADVNLPDFAGWISLHHAALLAPPTLVSHLVTHGCSPLVVTRRNLTALDIVTARATLPGREDVALLLEEAMRSHGWTGGRMEERRRSAEKRRLLLGRQRDVQDDLNKSLNIDPRWWGLPSSDFPEVELLDDEEDDGAEDFDILTPPPDFTSMLVFAPHALPDIFQTLITDFKPTLRNAEPANVLYMLSRFAILHCDHNWVEDLIIGATDAIEDTAFNRAEDLPSLVFWLYNLTIWLHLMKCDDTIRETCELLDSYTLIEEILNSVFVFIIRFAERRIDEMLDTALLDYSPLSSDFDSVQFEGEWSFLRTFAGKKKANGTPSPAKSSGVEGTLSRSPSPPPIALLSSKPGSFASLRQTFSRARNSGSTTPLQSLFTDTPPAPTTPSPQDIISFMTSLHTLLTLSDINPAIITQFWSQVMFWTACETFNRILTRKKYLCRSRALQINMNLSVIEEWVGKMGLPRGIGSHFAPVRDLLIWLQCLSSITEFSNLIATIQNLRRLNPLQMRRAVRDYKYEVNEGRMTDECIQYLAQLQKDWERHRVKVGVEALRKEIGERERERSRDGSDYSPSSGSPGLQDNAPMSPIPSSSPEILAIQKSIDMLFDRGQAKSTWEPPKPPEILGELLDSRHMLPLLLPSDPKMLGAVPSKRAAVEERKRPDLSHGRSASQASIGSRGAMAWRLNSKKLRDVGMGTLQWVDGAVSAARWYRRAVVQIADEPEEVEPPYSNDEEHPSFAEGDEILGYNPMAHLTPLTRKPSARSRGGRGSTITGDDLGHMADFDDNVVEHTQSSFL